MIYTDAFKPTLFERFVLNPLFGKPPINDLVLNVKTRLSKRGYDETEIEQFLDDIARAVDKHIDEFNHEKRNMRDHPNEDVIFGYETDAPGLFTVYEESYLKSILYKDIRQ